MHAVGMLLMIWTRMKPPGLIVSMVCRAMIAGARKGMIPYRRVVPDVTVARRMFPLQKKEVAISIRENQPTS